MEQGSENIGTEAAEQMVGSDAQSSLNALRGLVNDDALSGLQQQLSGEPAQTNAGMTSNEAGSTESLEGSNTGGEQQTLDLGVTSEGSNTDNKGTEETGKTESSSDDPATGFEIESELFGGKKKIGSESNENKVPEFKDLTEVNSFVKDKFGVEDFSKLEEKFSSLQEVETKYQETAQQLNNAEAIFKEMPPELYKAIETHFQGGNWRETVSENPMIDYQKEVASYKDQDLVEAYYPSKITEEQWEEYNDPNGDDSVKAMVEAYVSSAKDKYQVNQERFNEKQNAYIENAKLQREKFSNTLNETKSFLKEKLEGVDDGFVSNVEKKLSNTAEVLSVFYNEDGSLKKEAGLALAMATHGYDVITQMQHALNVKANNSATQQILDRTPNAPNNNQKAGTGSGSSVGDVRPEVKQLVDNITNGLVEKNVY